MRTDLTTAFTTAKNASSRKPRQLMVFQFPVAGKVYVSDQAITLGGVTYQALVESWGELVDSAGTEGDFSAETMQMSVTLWNGGDNPFSTYFLKEDPEDVEVLLYQWFDGLVDADKLLLDRFVIQDPIKFDEASRLLTLELVSVNMRYVGRCGATVTTALWPKALPEHVGKAIPLIFGDAGECNTLCVKTAPSSTLKGSIVQGSRTIECNESLGAAGFPASGILQIEEEKIQYSSRTDKVFTVKTRGYGGTENASHPDNAEVHQLITDHTYLVGELPLASITDVKVDGYPAHAEIYSTDLTGTYGKIIFNQKPYSDQFSASSQMVEEEFDAVDTDNTAWQAHYAIDQNKTSSSAMLNEVYKTLSVKQVTAIADQGLIVSAFLQVHHWETNVYTYDYCEVWVEGIGVVGRLSKPSEDDIFHLEAEVDIDHPHLHTTGDTHTHQHNDGSYGANASGHIHPQQGSTNTVDGVCSTHVLPISITPPLTGQKTVSLAYEFYGVPAGGVFKEATIGFKADLASVKVDIWCGGVQLDSIDCRTSGTVSINRSYKAWSQQGIAVTVTGSNVVGANIYIKVLSLIWNYDEVMETAADKVDPFLSIGGSNQPTYNTNLPNDVYPLLTNNRLIEILSQKSPSRTLIDRFDLSDFISPSWAWFSGRKVQIRYVGTADDVNVFIPWMTFEIEFRKKERVYSDRITATVSGNPANRPDQVIRTLLGRAGLPEELIDSPSFTAANTWYGNYSYTIDGVIDGSLMVGEAIRKVCRQTRSRLFWAGGKAKLAIRKDAGQMSPVKWIWEGNYQLRSITALRQSVQDLTNYIDLRYKIDRTSEPEHYTASVIKQDSASIAAHGKREKEEEFKFDLVRKASMASSVSGYYLSTLANPSTFYEFNTYLQQLELEKEDVLSLTSAGFHKIRKMPMRIKAMNMVFGSGKNRSINHLRVIAECLRYVLIEIANTDQVLVLDSIRAVIGKLIDLSDHVHAQDELATGEVAGLADEALISDELETLWEMIAELAETVTVSDILAAGFNAMIDDQVNLIDIPTVWRGIGFGSQDFGNFGFGGIKNWGESNPDELLIVDQLSGNIGCAEADTVIITEQIAGSTGFGSPGVIADGFSFIPFGR